MMIVVPNDNDSDKRAEAQAEASSAADSDPPPSYEALEAGLAAPVPAPAPAPAPVVPATTLKPSNHISLVRNNGSIRGAWLLDISLALPASLLPPLARGETEATRRNFNVDAKNGHIDVDISIAPINVAAQSKFKNKRLLIAARSSNGSVTTKLHAPDQHTRPSFCLLSYASNGSIHIHLPRSFRGPVVITTHNGSTKFSGELTTHLTTFSDAARTRRCFVGDYAGWTDADAWMGDEVEVEARNGSVRIQYDDEVGGSSAKAGFFGRLFGF